MKNKIILLAFFLGLYSPTNTLANIIMYADVPENHIYAPAIEYFTEKGLLKGYDDGEFGVDSEINRVEALKIIMDYWGVEAATEEVALNFSDIEKGAWYENSLKQAFTLNIIQGYPDGTFLPNQSVNRVEALKMILQSGGYEIPSSNDEFWYAGYLDYAIQNDLLNSGNEGDYNPEATLTRGEFVDLLYRLENNPYTGEDEYGIASYYSYSFDGANTASGTPLEAYGFMAAHKNLEFGTWVRVTNLNNNEYVDVKIVDRGPYVEGRIIDLTPAAFESIASLGSGIINVRIEILANKK